MILEMQKWIITGHNQGNVFLIICGTFSHKLGEW